MRCPQCGWANPQGARLCGRCGTPLAQTGQPIPWPWIVALPILLLIGIAIGALIRAEGLLPSASQGKVPAVPSPTPISTARAPLISPRPSPTPTPGETFERLSPENIARLERYGQLKVTSQTSGEWLSSNDWETWAEVSDTRIYIHHPESGVKALLEAPESISAVALSPDGRLLAAGFGDRVRIWRLADETVVLDTEIPADVPGMENSPVKVPLFRLTPVTHVGFSPDGRYLAACGPNSRGWVGVVAPVWVWETTHEAIIGAFGESYNCSGFAFTGDSRTLITLEDRPPHAAFWRMPTGEKERSIPLPEYGWDLAVSPEGSWLAVAENKGRTIRLFRLPEGAPGPVIEQPSDYKFRMTFSPDGRMLVTETGRTLRFWRTDDGRRVHLIDNAGELIGFHLRGLWLATEDYGRILIWAIQQ